ncbi:MAG: hypothetical protein HC853_06070 [Anaerolineae bacterium]|nr:hypothetical protein [Anaerolineae bacterium]
MSEYQHYEWLAIDRPLNHEQLRAVQALSSHMDDATPTHAQVTYSYGDFKHDPIKVLTSYFDAHLYTANWGNTCLAFRLPRAAVNADEIEAYSFTDHIQFERKGDIYILSIEWDDEDGGDWVEVDGVLAQVAGVRQQIINGDYRALYLAWRAFDERASEYDEGYDDGADEKRTPPPTPPGLDALNGSLKAFCDLFNIDKASSKPPPKTASHSTSLRQPNGATPSARLSRERCDHYLLQLIKDGSPLGSVLRKELAPYLSQSSSAAPSPKKTKSRSK